eukprot:tig00000581_g2228.t1
MTKKALIVGINYETWTQGRLSGCVNDSYTWKDIVTRVFGYPEENVKMIVEESSRPPEEQPTKANILAGLKWLVAGAEPGDKLFFQYSGHGSQVADKSGDEKDGHDECLCPLDCRQKGVIVDDDLNKILCKQVPAGVAVTVILDCCHSGSGMDLEHTIRPSHSYSEAVNNTMNDPMVNMQMGGEAPPPAEEAPSSGGGGFFGNILGALGGLNLGGGQPQGGVSVQSIIMSQVAMMMASNFAGGFGATADKSAGGDGPAQPDLGQLLGGLLSGNQQGGLGGFLGSLASAFGGLDAGAGLNRIQNKSASRAGAPDTKPKVVLYSGCLDDQCSADARFGGKAAGAMTYAFKMAIDCAVKANKAQPHANILSALRDFMKQKGFEQIPQLSANFDMDPSQELFDM